MDDRREPQSREPGVLQAGIGASLGKIVPDGAQHSPGGGIRSEDEEVRISTSASARIIRSSVTTPTTPSGSAAADGARMGQHEDVRPDGRHREIAGMDRVRPRHQWQRQARRVRRTRSAGRSHQGQARGHRLLRSDAQPDGWLNLGDVLVEPGCGGSCGSGIKPT